MPHSIHVNKRKPIELCAEAQKTVVLKEFFHFTCIAGQSDAREKPGRQKNTAMADATQRISDMHRSASQTDVARLREFFNDAVEIPITERNAWLMQNVADPDERQAIATLLLAYDGDGSFDVYAS